ncbi:leucine-rich repeat receptor-like serine/threonine/tyrosine-protein kinase SOBIR1 [Diospyros lotus]|uniref:leucine-rich repeat receptor-like serine/threonine/tyrosine-protein kinase SOBIR1 n=1 Tax=Diospyros lotus TaxID=55363 RepID=UPI002251A63F|nr:leucine-rich repeat receptor-like serine/threonine/tyrosine-protein kinase SOBIR1 [Diospyros lotus]
MAGTTPFCSLLTLFSVILLAQANNLSLDNPDHDALLIVQEGLGMSKSQRLDEQNPCNCAGVFCQRRKDSNNSYVLRVTRIFLKSRQLAGVLSPAIGQLSELKELSLPNNRLVDQIPPEIASCRKLEVLNLQDNDLSGEVPAGVLSSLARLRVLDLSSNRFSGNLNFLKYSPNLEILSLANNKFSGKVPSSLQSFGNLRVFNISGNPSLEVEGLVPVLNQVEGSVPVLNQAGRSSLKLTERKTVPKRYILAENSRTRSQAAAAKAPSPSHRSSKNTNTSHAPAPAPVTAPASRHKHGKGARKAGGWILGFLAGGLSGSGTGFLLSVFFKVIVEVVRGRKRDSGPAIFSSLIKKAEDLAFLAEGGGLASLEVIGRGGCGEVYKKELPGSNGNLTTLAIKKIVQPSKDATELSEEDSRAMNKKMRQIKSEIQTVGQIRHRNLLPLLAHVTRPECHFLVYEFMKNGSLRDTLKQVSAGTRELDWLARHKIALGVAAGLEYLHMDHSPRIIHRDLKPENILLDDEMEARIADFGFAKAVPDANTHVTTSNVAGTVGYIAPEYHSTLKFTDKCDIFSFGVVLGVLVIGKFPSDEFFQSTEEMSLVKWMRNVMTSVDPKRAIDPKLMGNGYEDQMLLVLKIACFCTLEDPKQRPNSKVIRCMLSQIKHD